MYFIYFIKKYHFTLKQINQCKLFVVMIDSNKLSYINEQIRIITIY